MVDGDDDIKNVGIDVMEFLSHSNIQNSKHNTTWNSEGRHLTHNQHHR